MPAEAARYMWLFCFFDLPVKTKAQRKAAAQFRKLLLGDGFNMLQLSVYVRVCRDQDGVEKHVARICKHLPKQGSVRTLAVTERQYARMRTLVGEKQAHEKPGGDQLLLL
ncbi:CRISPR-associated endonuclease Cas2 [Benzoatithermus flavus]|uniref:CRISPR-associated endoribonuclease Cas2 n=1 Tax=Benzoatithermus flavus TaxID=3108223 RepID=A0ABU8XRU4_9PROT